MAAAAQKSIREIDANQLITAAYPVNQLVQDATAQPRFRSVVSGALALLAFILAIGGVTAVVGSALAEQRRPAVIRLALGASRRRLIVPTVTRTGSVTVLAVVAAGCISVAGAKGASAFAAGLPATSLAIFAFAAAAHLGAVLLAAYLTTRRALAVDLVAELHQD